MEASDPTRRLTIVNPARVFHQKWHMIRSLKFRWAFVLLPLLLLSPLVTYTYPARHFPFRIRIIDAHSHLGLPNVGVIADHRITCYTDIDGVVRWGEEDLMDRDIHFSIRNEGYRFPDSETVLRVTHGDFVQLAVQPSNFASTAYLSK